MKQTAVEWLENEIFRRYKFTLQQLNCGPLEEAIQQAKEMEKQQTIDAYKNGDKNGTDRIYYNSYRDDKSAEQYYNETFNK